MKLCNKCGTVQPVENFNKKDAKRRQAYCRECTRKMSLERYHSDRETNAAKQKTAKKARIDKVKDYLRHLKESTPCMDCGQFYKWYQMDFDHVNGKKHNTISHMVQQGSAKWRILSEVTKCEIVCANCHRQRTFSRAGLSDDAVTE